MDEFGSPSSLYLLYFLDLRTLYYRPILDFWTSVWHYDLFYLWTSDKNNSGSVGWVLVFLIICLALTLLWVSGHASPACWTLAVVTVIRKTTLLCFPPPVCLSIRPPLREQRGASESPLKQTLYAQALELFCVYLGILCVCINSTVKFYRCKISNTICHQVLQKVAFPYLYFIFLTRFGLFIVTLLYNITVILHKSGLLRPHNMEAENWWWLRRDPPSPCL